MKFTLAVHDPNDTRAPKFAGAALEAGHQIDLVFFYHDGVLTADRQADDEVSSSSGPQTEWLRLHSEHDLPMAICIGAAARRDLVDESAPESSVRVEPGFDVVGLGQLIGSIVDSDRLITFAG